MALKNFPIGTGNQNAKKCFNRVVYMLLQNLFVSCAIFGLGTLLDVNPLMLVLGSTLIILFILYLIDNK